VPERVRNAGNQFITAQSIIDRIMAREMSMSPARDTAVANPGAIQRLKIVTAPIAAMRTNTAKPASELLICRILKCPA
jgi:hypothetical protein